MKKIILLITALFITSCSIKSNAEDINPGSIDKISKIVVYDKDDIALELQEANLTSASATFILINKSNEEITLGGFSLEKEENGTWYQLKLLREMMVAYTDEEIQNERLMNISWGPWYGSLPSGKYRIILNVHSKEDGRVISLPAEFTIE